MFTHPSTIFTEEMLKPEQQDLSVFADGMDNIVSTHQRVAQSYFADGTIGLACPPLRALLEIMAKGKSTEGFTLQTPAFRALFTREYLLSSDWYAARLAAKQSADQALWQRHVQKLGTYCAAKEHVPIVDRLGLHKRLVAAQAQVALTQSPDYRQQLVGTLGVQPLT